MSCNRLCRPLIMWSCIIYVYTAHHHHTADRTIKMKPIDVTSDSHVEYNEDSHEKDPKFKVGDCVKISKYKNIFAEGYAQHCLK